MVRDRVSSIPPLECRLNKDIKIVHNGKYTCDLKFLDHWNCLLTPKIPNSLQVHMIPRHYIPGLDLLPKGKDFNGDLGYHESHHYGNIRVIINQ
jgi:hypothetical protein